MNVFFDTEFTELGPKAQLISIGMVADNGQKFYAEFIDYNKENLNDWIKENVLSNLLVDYRSNQHISFFKKSNEIGKNDSNVVAMLIAHPEIIDLFNKVPENTRFKHAESNLVLSSLKYWFNEISNNSQERIQLVSDVCHYDMTLLCNLFGGSFNLPSNVNPVCYDICQDIWAFLEDDYDKLSDRMNHSFDMSREEMVNLVNFEDLPKPSGLKHNSLYDAEVIRYLYKSLIGD